MGAGNAGDTPDALDDVVVNIANPFGIKQATRVKCTG